jgi:hypothetical protein
MRECISPEIARELAVRADGVQQQIGVRHGVPIAGGQAPSGDPKVVPLPRREAEHILTRGVG